MAIVKRLTKGSALTHAELDGNFTDLDTRVSTLENTTDSDSQTLTLVGTDLSISSGNTVDLSGLGGGAGGIALTDISVTSLAAAGGGTLTYDNTTGVFDYTPPDLTGYLTSYTETDPVVGAVTGIVKADGAGNISAAVAGTDYSTFDGDYNSLTNKPTIPTAYTDADIDTHLNTSTATANQILSWDGADYAWVADQTGAGGTYGDTDVATYLNGNLDTSIIPDTNASYDLGSAEYKIRHLYLSDNSLKFTDTTDPLNIVEYSVGRTGTDITFNGSALKSTSSEDVVDAGTIDITKTNHFVTNGTTAVLPDGTYMGQKLEFWRVVGTGSVDINVNSAIYMDGGNTATGPGPIVWRLGDANQTLYSCIWNGVAWVLSHGGPGV